jgi:integrase/recombinase XerD
MLTLYRRHELGCSYRGKDPKKCSCPVWIDGAVGGKRERRALGTRNWREAEDERRRIEDPDFGGVRCIQPGCQAKVDAGRCDRHTRAVPAAIAAYHAAHQDVAAVTAHQRTACLRLLEEFLLARGVGPVEDITLEALNEFRTSRSVSPRTWVKELGHIRHFLRFCVDNEWCLRNWALKVEMPKKLKAAEREPYQPQEVARIIAACDTIGRAPYERLRARALVLALRHTGLRIGDVATLKRDRVRHGEVFIRTTKNGKIVRLPLPPELRSALDAPPPPRGAAGGECAYFFWSGNGSPAAAIRDVRRTLEAVYEASGVRGAISHRFRHTLATEVLEIGGSIEEAADILGDSPAIIAKHYLKWSQRRQARIFDVMRQIHGTSVVREETSASKPN